MIERAVCFSSSSLTRLSPEVSVQQGLVHANNYHHIVLMYYQGPESFSEGYIAEAVCTYMPKPIQRHSIVCIVQSLVFMSYIYVCLCSAPAHQQAVAIIDLNVNMHYQAHGFSEATILDLLGVSRFYVVLIIGPV